MDGGFDGRAALKARHRAALVAAARALVDERGPTGFTTDDLARRADVSRRTVFNHFAHLEDVVVAGVEEELESAIAAVETDLSAGSARAHPLDDLALALSAPAVPDVVHRLARALTVPGREAHADRIRQQALQRFGASAAARLRVRHPQVPALEVELLTTAVVHGTSVVAEVWTRETPGPLDAAARRRWDELLGVLLTTLRHGFVPGAAPPPTSPHPEIPAPSPTEGT